MAADQRTVTLPEHHRGAFFDGSDTITALRVRGVDSEYHLLVGKTTFSLGSAPECDLAIDSTYLSALHCVLERRGGRLRIHDQSSRNGTFFAGRREPVFDIGSGDAFVAASTTLYALNEEMRLARPVIAEVIGASQIETVDEALIAAVRGSHLVIVGEAGNDQDRLARAIHTASLRRRHPLVTIREVPSTAAQQEQLVESATRGTVVLRLGDAPFDPAFLVLLQKPETNARVIVCASTLAAASQALGIDWVARSYHLTVTPLRERPGDLLPLLERWLIDRRTSFRIADLTDANRDALCSYSWPGNLEELREVVDRLVQLAPYESLRQAAPSIAIPRTSLQRWIEALGITFPIVQKMP